MTELLRAWLVEDVGLSSVDVESKSLEDLFWTGMDGPA